jgi:zinc protease
MKKLFLLLLVAGIFVPAKAQETLKKTLPNGLTILARESHAAPVVAVRVYVRTGSIYEGKNQGSGLSHLFEHTLFEGTKSRNKQELNDELQAIGGQANAYTSNDVTAYYVTTAKNYFGRASGVLADMIQNATFPEAEVKVQQGVIHNEMNLGEDNPARALSELYNQTAFRVHPQRLPIIGYRGQFDALTRQDILDYYKTHYTPENTIVSVAGDVSAAEIFSQIEKDFGAWQRGAATTPALPSEPMQNAPRRATIQKDVNLTYMQIGWHTVPLQHPDLYALDVLSQILGGAQSSRLPLELQQKQNLVQSIGSYSHTPNYDAGVFGIRAVMQPQNATKVENLIRAEVRKLKANGVTEAELTRAKKQVRASFILGLQDVEDQAEQSAYDELGTGDPNYSKRYVANIQLVTAEQIKAVAHKYLRDDGVTVAIVAPKTEAKTVTTTTAKTETTPAKIVTLPNGVRLVLRPSKSAPTVSIVAMGMGGVRLEPQNKAGISNFAAQLLTQGTSRRNAEQLAELVDDLGGSMSGFSGYNSWGVESQWLASDWKTGLNLVAESALQPTFPEDEIEKLRVQMLAAIGAQEDDPQNAAGQLLRRLYYGRHPYSRSPLGTADAIKKLTKADIEAFWKETLQPKDTVLAIYGDFDPQQVETAAAFLFGKFEAKASALKAPADPTVPPSFTSKLVEKEGISQAVMFFGFPSVDIKNEDRYAIDVLDAALSGANLPGGRLHAKLRDNELVYVVHAYNSPGIGGGMFVIYAATTKSNRTKAKTIIEEEITKIRTGLISEAELERAKSMSISAHSIDLQTNSSQARDAASNELFGLGYANSANYSEKINAITLQDVRRVAQKYLDRNGAALGIVEPKTSLGQGAASNPPETLVPLDEPTP